MSTLVNIGYMKSLISFMKFLKLEKRNKISFVSFMRTRSLNALNSETLRELIALNNELDNDIDTKEFKSLMS